MKHNHYYCVDGKEFELRHHGVKGMKWGVRRYQNKDGSLTPDGLKRYRKEYDDIKLTQNLHARAKTVNRTGISAVDNYNSKYYDKQQRQKIELLIKRIGNRGLSQFDEEVKREGKAAAEEARQKVERLNKWIQETFIDKGIEPEGNALFLRDPQHDYDYAYKRYLEDHLVKR